MPDFSLQLLLDRLRQVSGKDWKDVNAIINGTANHDSPPHHIELKSKGRAASVLLLLSKDGHVLLTKRSDKLRSHPGQVAFPGGKMDPEDGGDDVVTALRETKEEVGLDFLSQWKEQKDGTSKSSKGFRILGELPTMESINHLCVTPIVAIHTTKTWEEFDKELSLNEDEVYAAFWTPLEFFVTAKPTEMYNVPWSGEVFVYRHYDFLFGASKTSFAITGLTAHIVHQFASMIHPEPQGGDAAKDAATSSPQSPDFHGFLHRRVSRTTPTNQEKHSWKGYYYILTNPENDGVAMLHQYDSMAQAQRKQQSANKKNRLRLESKSFHIEAAEVDDGDTAEQHTSKQHAFKISTCEGRIEWLLSASSKQERQAWLDELGRLL